MIEQCTFQIPGLWFLAALKQLRPTTHRSISQLERHLHLPKCWSTQPYLGLKVLICTSSIERTICSKLLEALKRILTRSRYSGAALAQQDLGSPVLGIPWSTILKDSRYRILDTQIYFRYLMVIGGLCYWLGGIRVHSHNSVIDLSFEQQNEGL